VRTCILLLENPILISLHITVCVGRFAQHGTVYVLQNLNIEQNYFYNINWLEIMLTSLTCRCKQFKTKIASSPDKNV